MAIVLDENVIGNFGIAMPCQKNKFRLSKITKISDDDLVM